jgi:hypothetical protein
MIERKASVIVCDDCLVSLQGKFVLSGIYPGDIVIPLDGISAPQLVFFFLIEGPREDPFKSLSIKITFPGQPPIQAELPVASASSTIFPDRKTALTRQPVLVQLPVLRTGRVETIVIHDKGEIDAGGIWITVAADLNAAQVAAQSG